MIAGVDEPDWVKDSIVHRTAAIAIRDSYPHTVYDDPLEFHQMFFRFVGIRETVGPDQDSL
ncbi:unannotated protein [freshwater metagenome]|uniref:Unannotated protein n=1 Tax=freshwater metagenome TaxID=449393 RepID=A0A6J7EUZ1_9ZZZZ